MSVVNHNAYRIQRVRDTGELRGLQEPWTALLADVPDASVFLTWEWVSTWWRHYGPGRELWTLAAWDGERLAGVAPWMLVSPANGAAGLRRVAFICYRPPARLDVIARPDEREAVCTAFLTYLEEHRAEWDVLDLKGLVRGSALKPHLAAMDGRYLERLGATSMFITLPDEWDSYLGTVTRKRRKNLRNARNRLEREYPGEARFHRVAATGELPAAMDTLVALNQRRWHSQGKTSMFDDDRFVGFHREMAATALERGWLRLYQLKVADQVIATLYCFRYGDVFYAYQSGFHLDWSRYSPSRLIIAHGIREAIAEGAREFDMLSGTEEHKLSWTKEAREDSHELVSNNWRGHRHLISARLFDQAVLGGRKVLPQSVRDRINQARSNRRRVES